MRVRRGFTQKAFADLMGFSPQLISKYEAGDTQLTVATLFLMGAALGAKMESFFEDLPCTLIAPARRPGAPKSRQRLRLEKLANQPIGTRTLFKFGTFSSPQAAIALVNKLGEKGWADIKSTPRGITVTKIKEP